MKVILFLILCFIQTQATVCYTKSSDNSIVYFYYTGTCSSSTTELQDSFFISGLFDQIMLYVDGYIGTDMQIGKDTASTAADMYLTMRSGSYSYSTSYPDCLIFYNITTSFDLSIQYNQYTMSHLNFEFHMGNSPRRIYGKVYDFGAFGI